MRPAPAWTACDALPGFAETASGMDDESFRRFYGRTARPLRAYLTRLLADRSLADDLLQESYLHLLRAKLPVDMDDQHRKNYLFRIATNLLREHHRRPRPVASSEPAAQHGAAEAFDQRQDLRRALDRLKPRERELLWLAYVEGMSHEEIARVVGAKEQSIRPMLARARGNLAGVLQRWGLVAPPATGEKP